MIQTPLRQNFSAVRVLSVTVLELLHGGLNEHTMTSFACCIWRLGQLSILLQEKKKIKGMFVLPYVKEGGGGWWRGKVRKIDCVAGFETTC